LKLEIKKLSIIAKEKRKNKLMMSKKDLKRANQVEKNVEMLDKLT